MIEGGRPLLRAAKTLIFTWEVHERALFSGTYSVMYVHMDGVVGQIFAVNSDLVAESLLQSTETISYVNALLYITLYAG